jgi:TRAP-type C4-dicarboxylate transport system permease small subunit
VDKIDRVFYVIVKGLSWVSAACLLLMMVVMCTEVLSRVLCRPLIGAYDIMGFLAAPMICLGIARTQWERAHVAIDIFVVLFSKRAGALLDTIYWLLGAVLFGIASWQLALHAGELKEMGQVSPTLWWPVYPSIYVAALGFLVFCLVLVRDFLRSAINLMRNRH